MSTTVQLPVFVFARRRLTLKRWRGRVLNVGLFLVSAGGYAMVMALGQYDAGYPQASVDVAASTGYAMIGFGFFLCLIALCLHLGARRVGERVDQQMHDLPTSRPDLFVKSKSGLTPMDKMLDRFGEENFLNKNSRSKREQ